MLERGNLGPDIPVARYSYCPSERKKLLQVTKDQNTSVTLNWKTRFYSPPLAFDRPSWPETVLNRSQKQSARNRSDFKQAGDFFFHSVSKVAECTVCPFLSIVVKSFLWNTLWENCSNQSYLQIFVSHLLRDNEGKIMLVTLKIGWLTPTFV